MIDHRMLLLEVPRKVAKDINKRAVDALRENVEYGAEIDEFGAEYAWANAVDVSVRGWLMRMVEVEKFSPTEAMEALAILLTVSILPKFMDTPFIEVANALDEAVNPDKSTKQ
jgi:hypothetical protein